MRNVGMIDDEEEIGERVAARVHRQAVLRSRMLRSSWRSSPRARSIMSWGDKETMREQLTYPIEAAQRPNIKLRVIPASVGNHPGLDGPFYRLHFRDRPGVIMVGNRTSCVYLEDDQTLMAYNHVLVELLSVALAPDRSVALERDLESRLA
ncbi:DUF5753 domain-containing protein [Actinophytocola sp.]|uniref:DUF5753 domain-containing protein n=1 Tax=Actinophytocola sp. TaxID=1872138 RepID=UPI0039C87E76